MKKYRGKRALNPTQSSGKIMRQTSITDHLQSTRRPKRSRTDAVPDISESAGEGLSSLDSIRPSSLIPCHRHQEVDIGPDWESKVNSLVRKHFGHSSLKSFQKEALSAWLAHQDCLVLAATGSGKSLCFQIPALLTGKVVIVISPLISLMHDQCFKLAKRGVSACFLGSGQPDSNVEQRAMDGMYEIVYVCPETIIRLIKSLQRLAENRGIALFAIDEVHCVSKWGHDFRPDYRRMSVLRENFNTSTLEFLKFDIPVMALTATATPHVREDILKSLHMSKDTKIVITSFFRPNLQFAVKHSITYDMDFIELIDIYTKNKTPLHKDNVNRPVIKDKFYYERNWNEDDVSIIDINDSDDDNFDESDDEVNLKMEYGNNSKEKWSVEYLEDEVDVLECANDWDVACGEFQARSPSKIVDLGVSSNTGPPMKSEDASDIVPAHLDYGPTIIYVPTRKLTVSITKYLCKSGVKAAAYNAKLPKSHLRQVHQDFHEDTLQVVVATIAFGMGIDKLNVRRIIHYGWPQSLEAYYQEAGRAGRDGKLAKCVLYANLSRLPTLLPSRRSEEQTKQAYKMLSDCHRYGMNTSLCRAKVLVEYFGEAFTPGKCLSCDVCVNGPPETQNLKEEALAFMQIIAAYHEQSTFADDSYQSYEQGRSMDQPNLRMFISKIREQSQTYSAIDQLWWRGLARILESKGYIREKDDKVHVQISVPKPTKSGLEFLQSELAQPFYVYPEADMLISKNKIGPNSSFAEWGKGWADPEIRRQRLGLRRTGRKPRQRKSRKVKVNPNTVRGRLNAKLSH